jgi:diketogulonate reductase-like aldo/keto reductase
MTAKLEIRSTITLNDGVEIPRFGLGVYQAPRGEETRQAVMDALAAGYRHVDTARIYGNEGDVADAIERSGVPRREIFVTTKLWNSDHGYDAAMRACEASLKLLRTEYVDLYLIHWPVPKLRKDSWRALETLKAAGKCRSIGVSNYTIEHLDELFGHAKVPPSVNQVEMSPYLQQRDLVAACRTRKVQLEAYSPLTQGERLGDPRLATIAKKHGKSSAQILIRWALQRDLVVIPKSTRRARIEENAAVFDFALDEGDLAKLDGLDEGLRVCWDPTGAP